MELQGTLWLWCADNLSKTLLNLAEGCPGEQLANVHRFFYTCNLTGLPDLLCGWDYVNF